MPPGSYYTRDHNGVVDVMTGHELSELFTSWTSWLGFARMAATGRPCKMIAWMGKHPLEYDVQLTPFPGQDAKPDVV